MGTGLFFGTFNPVHRGHESLADSFLKSKWIDDLWVVLTPEPPHKDNNMIASFRDRWNMLEIAFSDRCRLKLSDVEKNFASPHYTFRTLTYLKNEHPDRSFYLCIGGDTLHNLSTWLSYEKISSKADLLVAGRPGYPEELPGELHSFSVHFCDHKMVEISSSEVRKDILEGRHPGKDILNPEVMNYIIERGLYMRRSTS